MRSLLHVIDDLFVVCESVQVLLYTRNGRDINAAFVEQTLRFQELQRELYSLGYEEEFVIAVSKAVHECVFNPIKQR